MRRFLVFAGDNYYPRGGWDDFHSDHETREAAVAIADQLLVDYPLLRAAKLDWSQVVDASTGRQVHRGVAS